ncbi:hypothetical protein [Bartonella machadoae]|uniref:hypothetical protein n=1 Tax=Bartonella machadoae TaxID=2893471 RepID=UPI001F4CA6FE|nr:hypothetical protein [Bartonella machadoae]UNE53949.1 hypothetical protein LNM86_10260 [Bartonella machadoae]
METILGTVFAQRSLVFICRSVVRHYTALESAFLAGAGMALLVLPCWCRFAGVPCLR